MKKKLAILWILTAALVLLLALPAAAANKDTLRIGLAYGGNTQAAYGLENVQETGFQWGVYDENLTFYPLGTTTESKLSVLAAQTLYLTSEGTYVAEPDGAVGTVGAYHVQVEGAYSDFASAQGAASGLDRGFVAWVQGEYRVRLGAYDALETAQEVAALYPGSTVESPSQYAFTAVAAGTDKVLFQYDAAAPGEAAALAVQPVAQEGQKAVTVFGYTGNSYYGGFRFERINGGLPTAVNVVTMDDYIKGIVPYEMSPSWPLEALKAQAVCARTYATTLSTSKHKEYHFDLCPTTDCQAYRGTGRATALTDQAVDETAGQMARYQGKPIDAVYFSSDGGGTEDAKNVWGGELPYLKGKLDPYEADIADKANNYKWTKTFTAAEFKELLHSKNYLCADIVDFTTKQSPTGNTIEIKFLDSAGKSWTFSRARVRSLLGLNSIRFNVTTSGGSTGTAGYAITGEAETAPDLTGRYVIDGSGQVVPAPTDAYAVTSSGVEKLTPSAGQGTSADTVYTLTGTGWGHSVGMSQWGAYSMAKRGFGYQDILKFYYTDITVE